MNILYKCRFVLMFLVLAMTFNITGCDNFKPKLDKVNAKKSIFSGKILGTWVVTPGIQGKTGLLHICVFDPDNGKVNNIFSNHTGADLEGSMSPNGRHLALNLWDPQIDSLNLYVYDIETKKMDRLSSEYGEEREFSWFPDGENLVYQQIGHLPKQGDGSNIIKINIKTGEKIELGIRVPNDRLKEFWYDSPRVTPDGKKVIFTKGTSEGYFSRGPGKRTFQNALYSMNADGTQEQLLYTPAKGTISRVCLSPDGTKAVFNVYEILDTLNFPSEIWIYDIISKKATLILPNSKKYYQNAYPVFSANSKSIVFLSASYQEKTIPPDRFHLFKMDLTTKKIEPLNSFFENNEVRLSKISLIP